MRIALVCLLAVFSLINVGHAFNTCPPTFAISPSGFSIGDISDVDSSAAIVNDVLIWDGVDWTADDNLIMNSIVYSGVQWADLRVPLASAGQNPTTNPDFETYIGNTMAYHFDDTNANERSEIEAQLPHDYKEGTDIEIHGHVSSGGNSNSGNVEMQVECTEFANFDGGVHANTTIYNGVQALDGTLYQNFEVELGTMSGTGVRISAQAICSVNRNTSVSGDITGDIPFISVDFHHLIDTPGSKTETSK